MRKKGRELIGKYSLGKVKQELNIEWKVQNREGKTGTKY